ncbi:Multidrug resistance protein MdtA precursor [Lacunisphaera limnophila]|uniref:Multidrug resistance protein MdtA n=1 Tax=Lacunisphaera limnophila TaxID=1838286 RepID=A0A1D8AXB2_9BACT|nr:MdtA/MuxA family multidrug efflux RND transporter periplasmic adaptor subunit [Lacunisphaera limnophila]AOS45534.1 Multidrug resistance protein MdtA precursor [Lacunisphaera limnophila]
MKRSQRFLRLALNLMSALTAPSRKRWFIYALVALLFVAGAWYFSLKKKPEGNRWGPNPAWAGTGKSPAMPVRVVKAERRDLAVHLKAIGSVTPLNTVTVQSRVDGELMRLHFAEGQWVEKGQLLAEIDPETYRIRLAQAEGQLRQNQAQVQTARADLERFQLLYEKQLVTSQQMEAQQALVREREGALASDQAAADNARLQLAYTRIEAPIAGRLGLRRVDQGNLIRANTTTGLVTITQTRPIAVMSTVPEVDLPKVLEPLRAGEQLAVEAWDRGEQKLLARGTLTNVDNQIDLATGTLKIKAEFPNEDESLFPNQFVNIRLKVRTLTDAVVIPSAAVQFGSRGTYVFVINEKNQATVRDIVLGAAEGLEQAVTSGLAPGDAVVLEGIDRLREGRDVVVVTDTPAANPAPAPVVRKKK